MSKNLPLPDPQNVSGKNSRSRDGRPGELVRVPEDRADSLRWWVEQFFAFEVTTAASSQRVQRRDLELFLSVIEMETGSDSRRAWSPRLSRAFVDTLRKEVKEHGGGGSRTKQSIASLLI